MTKDDVLTIFNKLLDNNQEHFCFNDSKEQLIYNLAYNDGLIDMRDALIIRVNNEAVENEK